ncbi:MAG TPA: ABC transporter ATP-binding protein, partial [Micromonosporaceae bacterium]
MLDGMRQRQEWMFFRSLYRGDRPLALAWWLLVVLRGLLPAAFAVTMGMLIGAVSGGRALTDPLIAVGVVFIAMQVLAPVHQAVSANLGDRTAAWLYDQLTEACVRPPGLAHLEDAELAKDLAAARDF